jgi:hypothetical protein
MELLNYSNQEYLFVFTSSLLLLMSYYYQNINIYQKFLNQKNISNKETILNNLYILKDNIKENKYKLWSYQFTIFAITPLLYIFNIGGELKNIWLFLSIFLFIQFILEYYFFYLNILIKEETTNLSFEEILISYESKQKKEEIKYNQYQSNNLIFIKKIFSEKKDIINLSEEDKRIIYSFINGENSKRNHLKIENDFIRIYNKNNEVLELDIEDLSISKITEENTSYFKNFYDNTNFNNVFIIGFLEPIFMSLLLFAIISIQF